MRTGRRRYASRRRGRVPRARVAVPVAIPMALGLALGLIIAVSGGNTTKIDQSSLGTTSASPTVSASAPATSQPSQPIQPIQPSQCQRTGKNNANRAARCHSATR
jgi:hypothetical protein